MHPRRLIVVIGLTSLLMAASTAPAGAARKEGARADESGVSAEVTIEQSTGPAASSRRTVRSGPKCSYSLLPADMVGLADSMATVGYVEPKGNFDGDWYSKKCVEAGLEILTVAWRKPPTPRPPGDPLVLAEHVLESAPIPLPGIGMNPPPERDQLVRLPVLLWMSPTTWAPVSTTASAGGVTVSVKAVPQRVTWDMGNGDTIVCGPGTAYDPGLPNASTSDCSYAYPQSSDLQPDRRFKVTATSEWAASWTSTSGSRGDLGIVTRTSSTSLRVTEAQALNTVLLN